METISIDVPRIEAPKGVQPLSTGEFEFLRITAYELHQRAALKLKSPGILRELRYIATIDALIKERDTFRDR